MRKFGNELATYEGCWIAPYSVGLVRN